jgi:hypothetical protein
VSDPKAAEKRRQAAETALVFAALFAAARADVLRRFEATGSVANLLTSTWGALLGTRVRERALAVIEAVAPDIDPARVVGKVDAYADWFAKAWEESVREALASFDVLADDLADQIAERLDMVAGPDVAKLRADNLSVEMGNFAAIEQAVNHGHATKTWRTKGATTRPSHLALEGATVPIVDFFANGLQYPGAPGPPEERVNCDCYLTFGGA